MSLYVSFNNKMIYFNNKLLDCKNFPAPKTLRFKFVDITHNPISSSDSYVGTWSEVDSSSGIWDFYYNSTSWSSLNNNPIFNNTNISDFDIISGNLLGVTDASALFKDITKIYSLSNLVNTSDITNVYSMFSGAINLQSVGYFDTSSCTYSMSNMFNGCTNLLTVPLFDKFL